MSVAAPVGSADLASDHIWHPVVQISFLKNGGVGLW